MRKRNGYPAAGLVVLVIMLTIMWIHASNIDTARSNKLGKDLCIGTYKKPISIDERCRVEQIIRENKNRRSLNKSCSNKIVTDTVMGIIRGGLGGAILGGEIGIVPGMVAFGTLSGILSWSRLTFPISRFINPLDKSAQ
jgi:hypothetical protein